jgi:hypothetical protein
MPKDLDPNGPHLNEPHLNDNEPRLNDRRRRDAAQGDLYARRPQDIEAEWVPLSGGALEARRPEAVCPACVAGRRRWSAWRLGGGTERPQDTPLCFQCFRKGLDRERGLTAARDLNTASEARFQSISPFEPVDLERLERLRAERAGERGSRSALVPFDLKRRKAQIEARHALDGIRRRSAAPGGGSASSVGPGRSRLPMLRATELPFPESWLPFVVTG